MTDRPDPQLPPDRTSPLPGCAVVSQQVGEQALGTASSIRSWLLVEHADAWTADARERVLLDVLPSAFAARLDVLWEEQALRPLLIRRVGDRRRHLPERTVLVGSTSPDGGWVERVVVSDIADIARIDLDRVAAGLGGVGQPVEGPVWLVCTHGGKDLCCALNGRPVAAALDAVHAGVWECTHMGGDRFAGNLLVLPHGLQYGRLTPQTALATAAGIADGSLPTANLRGRTTASAPQQIAEAAVRDHAGITDLSGVTVDPSTMEEGVWRVAVHARVSVHDATTTYAVALRPRGAQAEHRARCTSITPDGWDVVDLSPVGHGDPAASVRR